jgi:hypothetical protein
MPRLTLWKPTKTNDFNFMDRQVREQFSIGGTGVNVHKYVGPAAQTDKNDKSQPNYIDGREVDPLSGEFINIDGIINETKIQDLLFLENRDRKYDPDIYDLRGIYNVQDNDFDLTQFGMFLSNDMLYMTFHINEMIEILGRKLLPGDVLELPHLRDDLPLDAGRDPIKKFYVVSDANRGAEGFSQTWYPHIWRVKINPISDSQEYYDILGNDTDKNSLKNSISTYKEEFNISDLITGAAQDADPDSGFETDHLYGYDFPTAGGIVNDNKTWAYGDTIGEGDSFPSSPHEGQYFIRTDFVPNRLFVRRGSKWERSYNNVNQKTWQERTYNASTFVFDDKQTTVVGDREFSTRQPISDVIRPRPDNGVDENDYIYPVYVDPGYTEE